MCWLNQQPPAFTSRNYAVAPFSYSLAPQDTVDTTIKAATTRYWSELKCWKPASVVVQMNASKSFGGDGLTVSFNDGRGCSATDILLIDASVSYTYPAQYEAYYFAAASQGYATPGLSLGMLCPQFPHMFLAIWKLTGMEMPDFEPGGNATAVFCEPQYYMEPVTATVITSNNSIVEHEPIGPKTVMSEEMFNSTHFEYLLALGQPPGADRLKDADIGENSVILQTTRLKNASISAPTAYSMNTMIGYVLGVSQLPGQQYLDFEVLQTTYMQAHQLLFALAMTHNFGEELGTTQPAVLGSVREVVTLVPAFAFVTESLLALVMALCIYMLWRVPRRTLHLRRDPDSLTQIMVLARELSIQKTFARLSTATDHELNSSLTDKTFHLQTDDDNLPLLMEDDSHDSAHLKDDPTDFESTVYSHQKHLPEMSWIASGFAALAIGICIAIFGALEVFSSKQNGLKVPQTSDFVVQMLLGFLPTAFATLVGAYLSLLCRTYSFIQPMQDLKKGNALSSHTLHVNYTSIPPPLIFLKAFRIGHYILGALSLTALLSNVLTVTLAGTLFREDIAQTMKTTLQLVYQPFVLTQLSNDNTVSSAYVDALYPVLANATGQTDLPTWTTTEYGYLPVEHVHEANSPPISEFRYESIGYGADFECVDLLGKSPGIATTLDFHDQGQTFRLFTNFTSTTDSSICQCSLTHDDYHVNFNGQAQGLAVIGGSLTSSISSFEIVRNFDSQYSSYKSKLYPDIQTECDFCQDRIVHGWVRGRLVPTDLRPSANLTATGRFEYNATIISCKPRLKTQMSLLRVESSGQVIAAQDIGPPNYDIPASVNLSATFNTSVAALTGSRANRTWHTDSVARDYSNYLFKKLLGNNNLLDSTVPTPSFENASAVVSDALSRLFAAQLFIDRTRLQPTSATATSNSSLSSASTNTTNADTTTTPGLATYQTHRIFLSRPMLIISLTILTLDLLVIIIFRLTLPAPFLPRMPFTIASQIAFFAGSHATQDVVAAGGDVRELNKRGYRYGYGRYLGADGEIRVGIEREGYIDRSSEKRRKG